MADLNQLKDSSPTNNKDSPSSDLLTNDLSYFTFCIPLVRRPDAGAKLKTNRHKKISQKTKLLLNNKIPLQPKLN
jgi:hypothetical protein